MKKILLMVLTMFVLFQVGGTVLADDRTGVGLFTQHKSKMGVTCGESTQEPPGTSDTELEESAKSEINHSANDENKSLSLTEKGTNNIIGGIVKPVENFMANNPCSDSGVPSDANGDAIIDKNAPTENNENKNQGGGFFDYFFVMDDPVVITDVKFLMQFIGLTQSLAFILGAFIIIFYAIMVGLGYERLDPMAFLLRLMAAYTAVYFLPFLMQDILNLANMLTDALAKVKMNSEGEIGSGTTLGVSSVAYLIGMIMKLILVGLGLAMIPVVGSFMFFTTIVIAYNLLKPMLTLMLWWYFRLLTIVVLAIFGPIMVILMALPQTASMAGKWVKNFVVEVLTQPLVMLGFYGVTQLMMNMGQFVGQGTLGFFGWVIVTYAAVMFLSEIPNFVKNDLLGGGVNMRAHEEAARGLSAIASTAFAGATMAAGNTLKGAVEDRNTKKDEKIGDMSSQFQSGLNERKNNINENEMFHNLKQQDGFNQSMSLDEQSEKFANNVGQIKDGFGQGSREEGVEALSESLKEQGLVEKGQGQDMRARIMAEDMIANAESDMGIGWDAANQVNDLIENGDLNNENLTETLKTDQSARSGETDDKVLKNHAASLKNDLGMNGVVGNQSIREMRNEKLNNERDKTKNTMNAMGMGQMIKNGESVLPNKQSGDFAKNKHTKSGTTNSNDLFTKANTNQENRQRNQQELDTINRGRHDLTSPERKIINGPEISGMSFSQDVQFDEGAIRDTISFENDDHDLTNDIHYEGVVENDDGSYSMIFDTSDLVDNGDFDESSEASPLESLKAHLLDTTIESTNDTSYNVDNVSFSDKGVVSVDLNEVFIDPSAETRNK